MSAVDLHLHSTASDGMMRPRELVRLLQERHIRAFSLTDHDTLSGIPEAGAEARRLGIEMIPGVELSCGQRVEVHILGYGMRAPEHIERRLMALRQQREARLDQMLQKLQQAGVPLSRDQIPLAPGTAPGRVHVARALVDAGHASGVSEAFQRYLVPGRPGYVEREKLTGEQGVRLILEGRGVPVLAHPGIIQQDPRFLPARVRALMEHGLMGLEVYHPRHTGAQVRQFDAMARELGLLVTGGSDCHSMPGGSAPGEGMAQWEQMNHDYNALLYKIGLNGG